MSEAELISQSEYARRRGWARQYVTQLVQSGVIVLVEGKVDVAQADAAYRERINPAYHPDKHGGTERPAAEAPAQNIDFQKARTMREAYSAQKAKLEYEQLAGALVDRAGAEREALECAKATREALLILPARLAERLAVLVDVHEIEALLEAEIIGALENLSQAASVEDEPRRAAG